MKYEYKIENFFYVRGNLVAEFVKELEDKINLFVSKGWEYVEIVTTSAEQSGSFYLVLRRPK